jgi:glycine/D-amino acid oxidase-like deaminating enzyme
MSRPRSSRRFITRPITPSRAVRSTWLGEALDRDPDHRVFPSLETSTTADVCIVGGGFTGLWTALDLKRRVPAMDIVVIDADICGGGASGRNGGFAMTWWSKFPTLQKLCGTDAALALARRSEDAVAGIGRFCLEHGIDAHFRPGGWLWTATNPDQVNAWDAAVSATEAAGAAPFERLDASEVAARSGSPIHIAGVYERSVATVQPALLARGMARVAKDAGVRIYERTAMRTLRGGAEPRVETPHGTITAGQVVLAMNGWAAQIPQIAKALVVVSSDVVATEPIADRLDALGWDNGLAISDSRRLINYYRRTDDGRVVFGKGGGALAVGGWIGASFARPSPRAEEVQSQFKYIYPSLWDVKVERSWRGPVDYSATGLPFFCRVDGEPNILVGAGFSGNGVGPSRLAGELLAEMLVEGGDAGLPAALSRSPDGKLPPEPLRYVGGRAVRAAVAHKERREDARRPVRALVRFAAGLDPTSFVDRGDGGAPVVTPPPLVAATPPPLVATTPPPAGPRPGGGENGRPTAGAHSTES